MGTRKRSIQQKGQQGKRRRPRNVHQFLIVLNNTDPLVWRRLQVPEDYSFWDLHVAIQDSMGWLDCHLHEFKVRDESNGRLERFGIPDDDFPDEAPCFPSWHGRISDYFVGGAQPASYVYDFGDDWEHAVVYEGAWPATSSSSYPRCLAGARACPPEDCGGVHGYAEFLVSIADPRHPKHSELLEWVGGRYDPDAFDATEVVFDDPEERWRHAFEK